MKKLRKINLGLVLTLIVVIAVVIYSIGVETSRNKDKGEIKTATEEFVKEVSNNLMLEENDQNLNNSLTDEKLDKYEEKIKDKLKNCMINNESAIDIQSKVIRHELEAQLSTENYKNKIDQEIIKISSYVFDGDQVTITFNRKVKENIKYFDVDTSVLDRAEINLTSDAIKTKSNDYLTNGESVTLKKIDGKWKVVYSNLQLNQNVSVNNSIFGM